MNSRAIIQVLTVRPPGQVRFTHHGCFIEDEGHVIVCGRKQGRMFILNTNDASATMFAKGQKVESDIDFWHKRISQVNFPRSQEMHSK